MANRPKNAGKKPAQPKTSGQRSTASALDVLNKHLENIIAIMEERNNSRTAQPSASPVGTPPSNTYENQAIEAAGKAIEASSVAESEKDKTASAATYEAAVEHSQAASNAAKEASTYSKASREAAENARTPKARAAAVRAETAELGAQKSAKKASEIKEIWKNRESA